MAEEWGLWIEHDGTGCPCVGAFCEMVFEEDPGHICPPVYGVAKGGKGWFWEYWMTVHDDGRLCSRIVRYRIRKPRGLTILQEIAADPQPVREDA